jgi:hypothetical protein
MNMHAPSKDKCDNINDRFYEEMETLFDQSPMYHMKILLPDFNAKVRRGDIFKPKIGYESSHETGNDNEIRSLNFAASKYIVVRSTMFPRRKIHKYTWTFPDHVLVDIRRKSRIILEELTVTLTTIW